MYSSPRSPEHRNLKQKPTIEKARREPQATKPAGTAGMLTTYQVAERLGLSRKRVNDYIVSGQLRATKGKQGHNYISESDFEEFRKNRVPTD